MRLRCRRCDRRFTYSGKGRPRAYCPDCSPPGTRHPERLSPGFPRTITPKDRARKIHAARAAAARAVARRYADAYADALAVELEKRGVA